MKARIIHTKFFESERVLGLSTLSRWLYMYYLTCSGIGLTGAFKWSDAKTTFETGIKLKDLQQAKSELTSKQLVFYIDSWIVVPGTAEKTGYNNGDNKTSKAFKNEYESLPDEIKALLDTPSRGMQGGYIPQEIRNQKSEIKGKGDARGKTLDEAASQSAAEVLKRHNLNYGTNFTSARSIQSNLKYWLEAYKLEQILEADDNIRYHEFWKGKMTPDILLRRKNTKGEDVDYIGQLLNTPKTPEQKPIRLGYQAQLERNYETAK